MTKDKATNITFRNFLKNIYQLFLESLAFIKNHKKFIFSLIVANLFISSVQMLIASIFPDAPWSSLEKSIAQILEYIFIFVASTIINITLIKYIHRDGEFSIQL